MQGDLYFRPGGGDHPVQSALNFKLQCLRELRAGAGKNLDSIVLIRIMRRGYHDPGGKAVMAGEKSDTRGGDHAGVHHINSP